MGHRQCYMMMYASIKPMALLGKRSRIRVAFYLDAVQDDMVRQLAKRADTTGADVIRAALTYGLPLVRKEVDESGAQAAAAELEAAREWERSAEHGVPDQPPGWALDEASGELGEREEADFEGDPDGWLLYRYRCTMRAHDLVQQYLEHVEEQEREYDPK